MKTFNEFQNESLKILKSRPNEFSFSLVSDDNKNIKFYIGRITDPDPFAKDKTLMLEIDGGKGLIQIPFSDKEYKEFVDFLKTVK